MNNHALLPVNYKIRGKTVPWIEQRQWSEAKILRGNGFGLLTKRAKKEKKKKVSLFGVRSVSEQGT